MAERSQYQYQQITGPVWRESVADKLAWLPRGQQPARQLPPNKLGDFVRPEYEALYKPYGLEWLPSERYFGRPLARALIDWAVQAPYQPPVVAYDPSNLEWQAIDRYFGRTKEQARISSSVTAPFEALYKPQNLEWNFVPSYRGFSLRYIIRDWTIAPLEIPAAAPYDPQMLEWQAIASVFARAQPISKLGSYVIEPIKPEAPVTPPVTTVIERIGFFPWGLIGGR